MIRLHNQTITDEYHNQEPKEDLIRIQKAFMFLFFLVRCSDALLAVPMLAACVVLLCLIKKNAPKKIKKQDVYIRSKKQITQ